MTSQPATFFAAHTPPKRKNELYVGTDPIKINNAMYWLKKVLLDELHCECKFSIWKRSLSVVSSISGQNICVYQIVSLVHQEVKTLCSLDYW